MEKETTVNVGVVHGGRLANVMAEDASAKLDVRFKTQEEYERIQKELKHHSEI